LSVRTIAIASDHGGFRLKADLVKLLCERSELTIEDLGTNGGDAVDYPDFAHRMAQGIVEGKWDRGILVCGTGVGMAIAANRHKGIRAVNCSDTYTAKLSRDHNDSNILCIGERVVGPGLAWDIVMAWLDAPASEGDRHVRRRAKIDL
jgi:ribose 5-phosphate isomerase B